MRTFLVTGCAGFIGSHLSEALLARGDAVVGVDSFSDYYSRQDKEANLAEVLGAPRFSLVEADLSEGPVVELMRGTEGVFHLAAQPGVRGSWGDGFARYAADNVVASQRVFDAAARRGIRVVWASSSSVYGDAERYPTPEDTPPRPISPYGVTKLTCEHLAGAYATTHDLDAVALRYFTVYGPRQRPDMAFTRIVRALANDDEFPLLGTGEQTRDVTFVGDAVTATMLAMDRGARGRAYNIGGGNEGSLMGAIQLAEELSRRRLRFRRHAVADGDVRRTAADTTAARRDLGWQPLTGLREGLEAQLRWVGLAVNGA